MSRPAERLGGPVAVQARLVERALAPAARHGRFLTRVSGARHTYGRRRAPSRPRPSRFAAGYRSPKETRPRLSPRESRVSPAVVAVSPPRRRGTRASASRPSRVREEANADLHRSEGDEAG